MTQKLLKHLFDYHKNGYLIRKCNLANGYKAGAIIKSKPDSQGYEITSVLNKNRKMHRVVFLWHYGWLPRFIDHINQNKTDNRIENLRPATTSQNMANIAKVKKNPLSKYKGVSFHKTHNKFIASIRYHKKTYHLGYFNNEKEAARAYDNKAIEFFGEFACLNFPSRMHVST